MSDKPITIASLQALKRAGERFACLTAYDASFATAVDAAGVEVILVGDSLGMVIQGHPTTVPVSVDDLCYHTRAVSRGCGHALLMADLPFMSCATMERAIESSARLMQEGHAHAVKLEGGAEQADLVRRLAEQGVAVCAHIGLRPQSVNKLGGFKVQGRAQAAARAMLDDARRLVDAGADLLLLECVPSALAGEITEAVDVPVIGIGAGPECDAQILVLYDMLGITSGHRPRFVKDFLDGAGSVAQALHDYVAAVKDGTFPGPEHGYE